MREPGLRVPLDTLLATPTLKARELGEEKEPIRLLPQGDHPRVQQKTTTMNLYKGI